MKVAIREFYNKINPEEYEMRIRKSPSERHLHKQYYQVIKETISIYFKNRIVLDLGCGTGYYTQMISQKASYVIGLDISRTMIKYAKTKNLDRNVDFVIADAHQLPIRSGSIESIVCIGLLEYAHRIMVLNEIKRVLLFNGMVLIVCPNKYGAYRFPARILNKIIHRSHLCNEPSLKELLKLFKHGSMRIIKFKMDDGLVYLPGFLDKLIGEKVYTLLSRMSKVLSFLPLSNVMLFLVKYMEKNKNNNLETSRLFS